MESTLDHIFNNESLINIPNWKQVEQKLLSTPVENYSSPLKKLTDDEKVSLIATSFSSSWGDQSTQAAFFTYVLTIAPNSVASDLLDCYHSLDDDHRSIFKSMAPKTEGHGNLVTPNAVLEQIKNSINGIIQIRNDIPQEIFKQIKINAEKDQYYDSIDDLRCISAFMGYLDTRRAFIKLKASGKDKEMVERGKKLIQAASATSF